jgi:hypothetical protein
VSMDDIAFDRVTNGLWVSAGNTGAVDVVEIATPSSSAKATDQWIVPQRTLNAYSLRPVLVLGPAPAM